MLTFTTSGTTCGTVFHPSLRLERLSELDLSLRPKMDVDVDGEVNVNGMGTRSLAGIEEMGVG
jgi:hypothetical protein